MFYRLNERVQLCGFRGLPFALFNGKNGETSFYTRTEYRLLLDCDGETELDAAALDEADKTLLDSLISKGLVEAWEKPNPLAAFSSYRTFDNPFKEEVHWSVTGDCNFRCKHCFMSAPDAKFGVPTTEQLLDIVEQMAAAGVRKVGITGGEPLIRGDFLQIIDALLSHGICITTIYTNGALVSGFLLDALEQRRIRPAFQISFDGVGQHDWLRGIPGAEEMALSAIHLLRKRGFRVGCSMVVHRNNYSTIAETVKVLSEAGCESLKLGKAEDLGCWNAVGDLSLSTAEIQQVFLDYIDEYAAAGMPITLELAGSFVYDAFEKYAYVPNDKLWNLTEEAIVEETRENRYYSSCLCQLVKKSMYIAPDGRILPCMSLIGMPIAEKYPSVFETSLRDILNHTPYQTDSSCRVKEFMEHNPSCARCQFAANCRGGCRAVALKGGSMDFLAVDPEVCTFFLDGWYEKFSQKAKEFNRLAQRKKAIDSAAEMPSIQRPNTLNRPGREASAMVFDAVLQYLVDTYRPETIIVFGSFAEGTVDALSDFDAFLIAEGAERYDTSVIAGTPLDVYIISPQQATCFLNRDLFIRLLYGKIVQDVNGTGARLMERVRDYESTRTLPDRDTLQQNMAWCYKMLARATRGGTEGAYRLHCLLTETPEIYCALRHRLFAGAKKEIRTMAQEDKEAFQLFDTAVQSGSLEAATKWIDYLKKIFEQ